MLTSAGLTRAPEPSTHCPQWSDKETEARRQDHLSWSFAHGNSNSWLTGALRGTGTIHDYFRLTLSPLQPIFSF